MSFVRSKYRLERLDPIWLLSALTLLDQIHWKEILCDRAVAFPLPNDRSVNAQSRHYLVASRIERAP